MAQISIIIPIYNSEKYIRKCIDSILNQTFKDFELILVNDGSTDKSREICESYKDKRIKIFNTENQGVSCARNIGIEKSIGKYLMFCDSDDYVEPEWCEKLYDLVKNNKKSYIVCSIMIKNYRNEPSYEQHWKVSDELFMISSKKEYFWKYKMQLLNSNCCKIYEKDIIFKYNIRFNEDITLGEDLIFNLDYLKYVNDKIIFLNIPLYNYILRKSESLDHKYYKNLFDIYKYLNNRIYNEAIKYNANNTEFDKYFYQSYYKNFRKIIYFNTYHKSNKSSLLKKIVYNYKIMKTKEFKKCINNIKPEDVNISQEYYTVLKTRNYLRIFMYDEDINIFNLILKKIKKLGRKLWVKDGQL